MKLIFLQRTLDKFYSGEADKWLYEFSIKGSTALDIYNETKLMKEVGFIKGREYEIVRGKKGNAIEVTWGNEKIYIKNNNSIIRVDKNGIETNLSESLISKLKKMK